VLVPIAIEISTQDTDGIISTQLHSPTLSSSSGWRLAMLASVTSFNAQGVLGAHMAPFHLATAAFQMSLFNNLEKDHALRQFLHPFSRYTMQWDMLVFSGGASLNAFPFGDNQQAMMTVWAEQYGAIPLGDSRPSRLLEQKGIFADDFSIEEEEEVQEEADSDKFIDWLSKKLKWVGKMKKNKRGQGKGMKFNWANFRPAKLALEIEDATEELVRAAVKRSYKTDCDVAGDVQLQAMFEALLDPQRGNLAKVTESGKLATVEDLVDLLTAYLYNIIFHGSARTPQVYDLLLGVIPTGLLRTTDVVHKPRDYEYSDTEILRALPNPQQALAYTSFANFFAQTITYGAILPAEGTPAVVYTDDLADAFAEFQEHFEEVYNQYIDDQPTAFVREGATPAQPDIHNWPVSSESR
jgi:hypothetical protein